MDLKKKQEILNPIKYFSCVKLLNYVCLGLHVSMKLWKNVQLSSSNQRVLICLTYFLFITTWLNIEIRYLSDLLPINIIIYFKQNLLNGL